MSACAARCDPKLGKCVGAGAQEECVALTLVEYHTCMDTCIPQPMADKIHECTASCRKSKPKGGLEVFTLGGD